VLHIIQQQEEEFKSEPMEDMKEYVSRDGSGRRIDKDLTTINHALEKSKQVSWNQGTGCDGEG
jgi:hypothetical protein